VAESLEILRMKRDAAEEAAREADIEAAQGTPGAARRAESLHREAQFHSARIKRLEADPAEHLAALYAERARVVTVGQVVEAAAALGDPEAPEQVEALAAKLASIDRRIDKLENPSGTIQ